MHAELTEITLTKCSTIRNCLDAAIKQLEAISTTPRLDAETLLASSIEKSVSYLIAWPEKIVESDAIQRFNSFILRRTNSEPVPYIVGQKEFWSMSLNVTPDTLIPRPETEILVEQALTLIPNNEAWHIADLGTGSGAIALAIAKERPHANIIATDISIAALDIAKLNAESHDLSNIEFHCGSWFDALPNKPFDLIASNPPYIRKDDNHLKNLKFEPNHALTPKKGDDGLSDLQLIIEKSPSYLKKGGFLLLEHGYDQQEKLINIFSKNGYHGIQPLTDLAGINRAMMAYT